MIGRIISTGVLVGLLIFLISCGRPASSPTATYRAYVDAIKKRDLAAYKKTFSKSKLARYEELSRYGNKPLDASLQSTLEAMSPIISARPEPAIRNEKIEGNKATIEVQAPEGKWVTSYFIKEDGEWKMTGW